MFHLVEILKKNSSLSSLSITTIFGYPKLCRLGSDVAGVSASFSFISITNACTGDGAWLISPFYCRVTL